MVSRYTLIASPENVSGLLGVVEIDDFPPRYNIAPGQPVGIVRFGYDGRREFALALWGLLPAWVGDPSDFAPLTNARCETVADKPSFKSAFKYRRCLLPMNGFFVWGGQAGKGQPLYFRTPEHRPFAVAGIWENWMGADGSELETVAAITCPANQLLRRHKARMPAIVAPSQYAAWLDWRGTTATEAQSMLRPAAEGFLDCFQVGTGVIDRLADGPDLISPVDDDSGGTPAA